MSSKFNVLPLLFFHETCTVFSKEILNNHFISHVIHSTISLLFNFNHKSSETFYSIFLFNILSFNNYVWSFLFRRMYLESARANLWKLRIVSWKDFSLRRHGISARNLDETNSMNSNQWSMVNRIKYYRFIRGIQMRITRRSCNQSICEMCTLRDSSVEASHFVGL